MPTQRRSSPGGMSSRIMTRASLSSQRQLVPSTSPKNISTPAVESAPKRQRVDAQRCLRLFSGPQEGNTTTLGRSRREPRTLPGLSIFAIFKHWMISAVGFCLAQTVLDVAVWVGHVILWVQDLVFLAKRRMAGLSTKITSWTACQVFKEMCSLSL